MGVRLYQSFAGIICFLIIMLATQTFFGEKSAQKMAFIIMLGIFVLQADPIVSFFSAVTNNLSGATQAQPNTATPPQSSTHTSESGATHGGGSKGF